VGVEIKPFLMDDEQEDFVVFMMKRDDNPNAYIWVNLNDDFDPQRDIRVTTFYGLPSYCNHSDAGFYAGEMPEDKLAVAEERLAACPKDVMSRMVEAFNDAIAAKMEDEDGFKEYSEWEDDALKGVSPDGKGTVYF